MDEERETYTTTAPSIAVSEPVNGAGPLYWYARVPATVIRDRRLKSGTRDVLTALLLYADATLTCHPSQGRIADDLGISREEVNRRIRQLRTLGYVTCDAPSTKGGTAVYHLDLAPRCDETVTPSTQPVTVSSQEGVIKPSQGCDETVTPPVIKRSHRTYPENRTREQRETDADASGATERATSPSLPLPEWIPARVDTDRSELDYWLRAAQAVAGNRRAALLVYLAHEKLGASDASGGPAYGRLSKLARECGGVGVVVRSIMRAAGEHIDGDALDYLTAMLKHPRTTAPPGGRKPPGPPDVNLSAIPRLNAVDWDAVRAQSATAEAAEAEKRKDGA